MTERITPTESRRQLTSSISGLSRFLSAAFSTAPSWLTTSLHTLPDSVILEQRCSRQR